MASKRKTKADAEIETKAETKKQKTPPKATRSTESRPKRSRRTTIEAVNSVYDPIDFTMKESEGIKITKGRGSKLSSFAVSKSSIESSKRTGDEIAFAHQFLFGKKGKVSKKDMKTHLLDFNGYLKPIPTGKERTDKEVDRAEEQVETKMSKRAYALNKAQIVDLCNFFALTLETTNEEPKMDKDTCIDRLLDFLGAPHKDWLASSVKEPSTGKKSTSNPVTKKKAAPKATTQSDYQKVKKAIATGKVPSEDVLRSWVRAYVACFNLDKATTKHAIITCSEKFGVDMSKRKQQIKQLLAEEL